MKTILIVDDEESVFDRLKFLLEVNGFEAFYARNGVAALEFLEQTKPSIIVMDFRMPELDGVKTARQIKQNAALSNIPIIGYTAFAHDFIRTNHDLPRLFVEVLTKSNPVPVLLKMINKHVPEDSPM